VSHPALVIFDLAGTTIEDRGQVPAAFDATLKAERIVVTKEQIAQVRGASKRLAIRSLVSDDHRADAIYANFCAALTERYRQTPAQEIPGTSATFAALRERGIKIGLNSGFDDAIVAMLFDQLGWNRTAFDAVVTSDDVALGRPAPDMILSVMSEAGVTDPFLVANVGDTALDLQAAANAGVRWNVGVLSGAHGREVLQRAPRSHIIGSVAELMQVFVEAGL
jgi:phosphonatase-like hydrolase